MYLLSIKLRNNVYNRIYLTMICDNCRSDNLSIDDTSKTTFIYLTCNDCGYEQVAKKQFDLKDVIRDN